jgi:hypothetical protein
MDILKKETQNHDEKSRENFQMIFFVEEFLSGKIKML